MNEWRLIESPAAPGDWNMAVDAALLELAGARDECCLRFYTWSEPTLSLGYFQALADRRRHRASLDCAVVRRSTGGGAILHDRELTYSITSPANHRLAGDASELYRLFHDTLIEALSEWDLMAIVCQRTVTSLDTPFLCFQRRASGDVLLDGVKIAGSAQRRRRSAVLAHGSVLLNRSAFAPELNGIAETGGVDIPAADLANAWRARLAKRCQVSWRANPLTEEEIKLAGQFVDEVYGHTDWTARR